ncbi:MAG: SMC-Scp complex subunit ScpB [Tissierellia bacterium]|nr:SMC-Scp complex subunit ScpB [Tissierellia bacterium]
MNNTDLLSVKSQIEALLFAWGDPLEVNEVAQYFDMSIDQVREVLHVLQYEYENRGIRIQFMGNQVQMNTNQDYNQLIERFGYQQRKKSLSSAAMECLSIVAYLQPTTKVVVEQVRGVKSDGPIQTLVDRGFLREAGKLKQPGRPYVYKTTDFFLKCFELETLNDLPELIDRETIKELLKFTEIKEEDIELILGTDEETNEQKSIHEEFEENVGESEVDLSCD